MVTPAQCQKKYGPPANNNKWLVMWNVPSELHFLPIPKKIFLNKDLIKPLLGALENLIKRGFAHEMKTWDGCFNIRQMRGLHSMSLHSWAVAVDVNAESNGLGKMPSLSYGFVQCWKDAGFDWGGDWKRKDGMHFQLKTI